jgi:hypothetical protein
LSRAIVCFLLVRSVASQTMELSMASFQDRFCELSTLSADQQIHLGQLFKKLVQFASFVRVAQLINHARGAVEPNMAPMPTALHAGGSGHVGFPSPTVSVQDQVAPLLHEATGDKLFHGEPGGQLQFVKDVALEGLQGVEAYPFINRTLRAASRCSRSICMRLSRNCSRSCASMETMLSAKFRLKRSRLQQRAICSRVVALMRHPRYGCPRAGTSGHTDRHPPPALPAVVDLRRGPGGPVPAGCGAGGHAKPSCCRYHGPGAPLPTETPRRPPASRPPR